MQGTDASGWSAWGRAYSLTVLLLGRRELTFYCPLENGC